MRHRHGDGAQRLMSGFEGGRQILDASFGVGIREIREQERRGLVVALLGESLEERGQILFFDGIEFHRDISRSLDRLEKELPARRGLHQQVRQSEEVTRDVHEREERRLGGSQRPRFRIECVAHDRPPRHTPLGARHPATTA